MKKVKTIELPSYYQDLYNYFIIIDKFYTFTTSKKIGKFTVTRLQTLLSSTGTVYCEEKLRQLVSICSNIIQLAYITDDTINNNNTFELEISFPKCSQASIKGSDKRKKMVYDSIQEYLKKFNDINNIPLPLLCELPKQEGKDDYTDPFKYSSSTAFPFDITGSPIKNSDDTNNNTSKSTLDNPMDIINYIKTLPFYSDQIQAMRTFQGKPPQYQELNKKLNSNILEQIIHNVLKIDKLYKHQALGIDAIKRGDHLVVSTSTASGKSMIYNVSVIDAIIENPNITALYLFPTKALAQDQLRVLNILCNNISEYTSVNGNHITNIEAHVCDGDTSKQDRKLIKSKGANILITNPDFLHYTMLVEHKEWIKIFQNIRYVVLDEAHYYKGVFGINVSFILRRLIRICLTYGSYPQFICCSATIGNPREHICKLIPIDFIGGHCKLTVLDAEDDGSPSYERTLLIWNPKLKKISQSAVDAINSTSEANEISVLVPLKEERYQKVNEFEKSNDEDSLQHFLKGCENNVRTLEGLTERAERYKNTNTNTNTKRKRDQDESQIILKPSSKTLNSSEKKKYEERTSSIVETSLIFSTLIKKKIRTLAFCKVRKLVELVLLYTLQDLRVSAPDLVEKVDSYRGGYTKEERRRIEFDLFSGNLIGITATSALEVGMDIGSLDVVLTMGFPGSFSSFWQQIGRAGRSRSSLCIMICFDSAVDQFFAKNPETLFDSIAEPVTVDNRNIFVIRNHILAASKEIPLCNNVSDRMIFGESFDEVVEYLIKVNHLYYVTSDDGRNILVNHPSCHNPARNMVVRHIDPLQINVFDDTINEVIDSLGYSRAFYELFEGAIYMHRAKQYIVTKLDLSACRAHCKPCNVNYFTGAMNTTSIKVVKVIENKSLMNSGSVNVVVSTYGYRKMCFKTGELLEMGECSLPPMNFETRAVWIDLPLVVKKNLEMSGYNIYEAIHSVNHLLLAISPMFSDCDVNDLGTEHRHGVDDPYRIIIYDKFAGGLGICDSLFNHGIDIIVRALAVLNSCGCTHDKGCPSCIFDHRCNDYNNDLSKAAAERLLKLLYDYANENIQNDDNDNKMKSIWSPTKIQKKELDQMKNKLMDYKINTLKVYDDDYKHLSNFEQDFDLT